jgi:hypothetical protein
MEPQTSQIEGQDRVVWSVNDWCAEAGIGRVSCYKEIKLGRIVAKKAGARTLIATSPKSWIDSLPTKDETGL